MEDLIGWLLMIALITVPGMLVFGAYMLWRRKQRSHEAKIAETLNRRQEAYNQWKENHYGTKVKTTPSYASQATSTSSTTTTSSNDSLLADLATMYVLNSALQHGSATAKVDYDTGTIKTDNSSSFSWGLDDSDSRRSASSSFSSSDSDSSWSSSSSSSDSGPSSDW